MLLNSTFRINMNNFLALSTAVCFAALSTAAFAGCGPHKSLPSNQMVDVTFGNKTAGTVNVIWYTFTGGRKIYQTLAAGQSYVQSAYTKHVWKLTDTSGKCISTLVIKKGQKFKVH
jgi:VHL beta domain